jgi:hypothetical protein
MQGTESASTGCCLPASGANVKIAHLSDSALLAVFRVEAGPKSESGPGRDERTGFCF